jgi:hypothetical protein
LEATITLSYKTKKEAKAVSNAVTPDNEKLPPGLFVTTSVHQSNVLTTVKCETSIETFMATLDDFFSCVSVAENALSATKRVSR